MPLSIVKLITTTSVLVVGIRSVSLHAIAKGNDEFLMLFITLKSSLKLSRLHSLRLSLDDVSSSYSPMRSEIISKTVVQRLLIFSYYIICLWLFSRGFTYLSLIKYPIIISDLCIVLRINLFSYLDVLGVWRIMR